MAAAVPAQPAGWATLTLPIENPEQAARLVLSLAPEAEVLAPPALRELVARWAQRMATRHRRSAGPNCFRA